MSLLTYISYADDCVIYREIHNDHDNLKLQQDLDNYMSWCENWKMELNSDKYKSMRVSRLNEDPPIYKLNNINFESVKSYRYLGVHLTSALSWKPHIKTITSSANRMLGYLRRNFSTAPVSLKLLLHKTLVRPKLEYAAAVWDPCHANLDQAIELVQNNACRFYPINL